MLAAVNYHYIRNLFNDPYPSIFGKTPVEFENQIKLLSQLGDFVSANEIKEAVLNGKQLPERAIIITFDDGLYEQYENALPVLKKYNIPAIFFINTSNLTQQNIQHVHKIHMLRANISPEKITDSLRELYRLQIEKYNESLLLQKALEHYKYDNKDAAFLKYLMNFVLGEDEVNAWIHNEFKEEFGTEESEMHKKLYMSEEQIKDLYKLGMLGSHSHSHIPVGQRGNDIKIKEAKLSQEIIYRLTGGNVDAFSFPYGSHSSVNGMAKILARANFSFAFTMERAINYNFETPFALARLDNNDVPLGKAYNFLDNDFYKNYPAKSWEIADI